ncbi:MAG: RNA polymerase sigma factor RpoH [Legionellales bacterium]|nr:RNA polymerase sigma factor RpoH [Legionellales bacterium]
MSNNIRILSHNCLPASVGSLDDYVKYAYSIPLLSAQEERNLAKSLINNNDLEAAKKLVLSHLRYVVRIAQGYSGYGLALSDLIQEGNIGLMKAVKRFDPDKGVRLVSFAVHWIKSEIHEFVIKNWKIVKVATTKAQRKLFFNLRSMKKRLGWFTKEEIQAVANDLGVKPEEVILMEQRLNASDASFENSQDDSEPQDINYSPANYLTSDSPDPSAVLEANQLEKNNKQKLKLAFSKLDIRSQEIIQKRWLDENKSTLQDLAKEYNVSAERIRQLENKAILNLRNCF